MLSRSTFLAFHKCADKIVCEYILASDSVEENYIRQWAAIKVEKDGLRACMEDVLGYGWNKPSALQVRFTVELKKILEITNVELEKSLKEILEDDADTRKGEEDTERKVLTQGDEREEEEQRGMETLVQA
jgi:hypothetical protein